MSVVVPIYNVERYLHECLDSLAHQTLRDIEVVMVDDGSTDGSAQIAASFAEGDPRFRLVRQENGGLGHARNTGTQHARGRYLAFVDSDDVVRPDAYELMAGSLDRTGSDFATGNFHRLAPSGIRQAGMVFTGYYANRPRTHVRKHPALLYDRTAWNKLFRRSFWDQHGFRWPEGVLYEDIPVTLPAHVLARSVDVIRDPVYLWRERAGEAASITQRRTELRAIRDRHAAVDGVSRFLADRDETTLKRLYDRSVAEQDFRYFLTPLDQAGPEFRAEFLRLVNDFFDRAEPGVFDELPALQRLEWHLVRRGLMPELLEVIRFEKSGQASRTPWVRRRRKVYGGFPFFGDPRLAIPDEVYRLSKDELPMPARIEQVWWDGDVLRLSGFAFISFLGLPTERSGRLRLTLEESGHPESVVRLDVRRTRRPDVTELMSPNGPSYDWSGWEASVPVSALRHQDRFRSGSWRLRIELRAQGVTRRRWLSATEPGPSRRPGWRFVDGARIVPTTTSGDFGVEVAAEYVQAESVRLDGPVVELAGPLVGRTFHPEGAGLYAARLDGSSTTRLPVTSARRGDGTDVLSRFDLARLLAPDGGAAGGDVRWELLLDPGDEGARLPVAASSGVDLPGPPSEAGPWETRLLVTRTARLQVERRWVRPEVRSVRRVDGGFEVTGRYAGRDDTAPEAVLLGPGDQVPVPVDWDGSGFTVRLAVAQPGGSAGLLLDDGPWGLHLRDPRAPDGLVPVEASGPVLHTLPVRVRHEGLLVAVVDVEAQLTVLVAGVDRAADAAEHAPGATVGGAG